MDAGAPYTRCRPTALKRRSAWPLLSLRPCWPLRGARFFDPSNLADLVLANLPVLIAAIGAMLVILTGEIDISVGSAFAVCSVFAGALAAAGAPMPAVILGALARRRRHWRRQRPLRRVASHSVDRRDAGGHGRVARRPSLDHRRRVGPEPARQLSVVWPLAARVPLRRDRHRRSAFCSDFWMLRSTRAGPHRVYATGSSAEAARLAAIDVATVRFSVFVVAGMFTALAAVVNAVRFTQVPPNTGLGFEMKVIAAVVVGGAAITGGRGTVAGTLLGAILLGMSGPALTFLGASAYWERALQGGIILAAVAIQAVTTRRTAPSHPFDSREHVGMNTTRLRPSEAILAAVVGIEILVFSIAGERFATVGNSFEITRLSVELGLLALALTPIIVTGGIDLSVGSLMGLSAVMFGTALQDWQMPLPAAVVARARRRHARAARSMRPSSRASSVPPLIVTLGTMSLFRGIAEGITEGAGNFSGFPAAFLALGQGYLGGVVPAQLPILVVAAIGLRAAAASIGRRPRAGSPSAFGEAGARYAGLPVARRVALAYRAGWRRLRACGDHLRRAPRTGTIGRRNRLRARGDHRRGPRRRVRHRRPRDDWRHDPRIGRRGAADKRPAARGAAVGACRRADRRACSSRRSRWIPARGRGRSPATSRLPEGETLVRNSQVAILCAAILAGALLVAGTNVWMVRSLVSTAPSGGPHSRRPAGPAAGHRDDAEGQGRPVLRQLPASAPRKRRVSSASI